MHVIVSQRDFAGALKQAQLVAPKNDRIPILSHVLLRAEAGRFTVTATDLEIAITIPVPAEIIEEGAMVVMPPEVVRKLAPATEIDLHGSTLRAGPLTVQLPTLLGEDFPALTLRTPTNGFSLPAETLRTLLTRTAFAISTEETRYYLNGVYMHEHEGETLRVVATDGHRLAVAETPLPDGALGMAGVIIPKDAVKVLLKLLARERSSLSLAIAPNYVATTIGETFFATKLIDGTFPEYQRVIPTGNTKQLLAPSSLLAEATNRVASVSRDRDQKVALTLSNDSLTISATNPETNGSLSEDLAIRYREQPLTIGFQAKYLRDVLAQIPGEMEMLIDGEQGPMIIRGVGCSDAFFVQMPIRV